MKLLAMTPHTMLQFNLVLAIICTTLSSPESIPRTRQQRSTANLEYVIRVLEEQGRLGEVDKDLLRRIQASIHGSKVQAESYTQSESKRNFIEHQVSSSPTLSALERAKIRQQKLFGARGQNISPQRSFPFSSRKQLLGGECQALKTENSILKQQLLVAQEEGKGLRLAGQEQIQQILGNIQVKKLLTQLDRVYTRFNSESL